MRSKSLFKGEFVSLRALEITDVEFLYELENDCSEWHNTDTLAPFSRYILETYVANANKDIFEAKQLRLVITENPNPNPVGLIDFFEFDAKNRRAGIGIILLKPFRQKGFATEAVSMASNYAFAYLGLSQIHATIAETNVPSIKLFSKLGFEISGRKKAWHYIDNGFTNALFLQKFNPNITL